MLLPTLPTQAFRSVLHKTQAAKIINSLLQRLLPNAPHFLHVAASTLSPPTTARKLLPSSWGLGTQPQLLSQGRLRQGTFELTASKPALGAANARRTSTQGREEAPSAPTTLKLDQLLLAEQRHPSPQSSPRGCNLAALGLLGSAHTVLLKTV